MSYLFGKHVICCSTICDFKVVSAYILRFAQDYFVLLPRHDTPIHHQESNPEPMFWEGGLSLIGLFTQVCIRVWFWLEIIAQWAEALLINICLKVGTHVHTREIIYIYQLEGLPVRLCQSAPSQLPQWIFFRLHFWWQMSYPRSEREWNKERERCWQRRFVNNQKSCYVCMK